MVVWDGIHTYYSKKRTRREEEELRGGGGGGRGGGGGGGRKSHLITSLFTNSLALLHSHQVDGGSCHESIPQLQQVLQLHVIQLLVPIPLLLLGILHDELHTL